MTSSQRDEIAKKLKDKYDRTAFEIVESDEVPTLADLPQGQAAKLDNIVFGFFDIRGFTAWSSTKRDRSVFKVLEPSLAALTRVIRKHDGTIEKPTGDGLMFIIGANESAPDKVAVAALQCALDLADVMDTVINPFMKSKRHIDEPLGWGIGLALGNALIAKVGIRGHDFLTSISKAANFASKLEDEAQAGHILVNEGLYKAVPEGVEGRLSSSWDVEGENVYRLDLELDDNDHPTPIANSMTSEQIERYQLRNWMFSPPAVAALDGERISKPHRWFGQDD